MTNGMGVLTFLSCAYLVAPVIVRDRFLLPAPRSGSVRMPLPSTKCALFNLQFAPRSSKRKDAQKFQGTADTGKRYTIKISAERLDFKTISYTRKI